MDPIEADPHSDQAGELEQPSPVQDGSEAAVSGSEHAYEAEADVNDTSEDAAAEAVSHAAQAGPCALALDEQQEPGAPFTDTAEHGALHTWQPEASEVQSFAAELQEAGGAMQDAGLAPVADQEQEVLFQDYSADGAEGIADAQEAADAADAEAAGAEVAQQQHPEQNTEELLQQHQEQDTEELLQQHQEQDTDELLQQHQEQDTEELLLVSQETSQQPDPMQDQHDQPQDSKFPAQQQDGQQEADGTSRHTTKADGQQPSPQQQQQQQQQQQEQQVSSKRLREPRKGASQARPGSKSGTAGQQPTSKAAKEPSQQQRQQQQQQPGSQRGARERIPAPPPAAAAAPGAALTSPRGRVGTSPRERIPAPQDNKGPPRDHKGPPRDLRGSPSRGHGTTKAEGGATGSGRHTVPSPSNKDRRAGIARTSGRESTPPRRDDRGVSGAAARRPRDEDAARRAREHSSSGRDGRHPASRDRDSDKAWGREQHAARDSQDPHRSSTRARERSREPEHRARDRTHGSTPRERGTERTSEHGHRREREQQRPRQQERAGDKSSGRAGDSSRERAVDKSREQARSSRDHKHSREHDRSRRASSPGSHRQQQEAASRSQDRSGPPASAAAAAAGSTVFQVLDKFLAKDKLVEEVLLPTPSTVNTIHVPGGELLNFIALQQWALEECQTDLPLLVGAFVLVRSHDIPELLSRDIMEACGYGKRGSGSAGSSSRVFAQAVAARVPWRLRQIQRVEMDPGMAPGDAVLVLQGGGRVPAAKVSVDTLVDAVDYEYLCCELAELQEGRHMATLRVYDIAHTAWRMRTGTDLQTNIDKKKAHQAELQGAGYDAEVLENAWRAALVELRGTMQQLPPLDWVSGPILEYVELNPFARPDHPEERQQALSQDQVHSLMRCACDAWRHYIRSKLCNEATQPITEYVPWSALPSDDEPMPDAVAAAGDGAGQFGAAQGYLGQYGLPAGGLPATMAGQVQQQQVAGAYSYPAAAGAAAAAAGGGAYGAGVMGAVGDVGLQPPLPPPHQQQPSSLLDLGDEFADDDYGFFDDPLAPVDTLMPAAPLSTPSSGMAAAAAPLSAAGLGSGTNGGLPRGLLSAGMTLDPSTRVAGDAPLKPALFSSNGAFGSGALPPPPAATPAAAAAPAPAAADYNYWVERGNATAAASDPRRAWQAAAGRGPAPGDQGLGATLGPMWGGRKPPPGMADADLQRPKQQQQQQQRDGPGRVSAFERLSPARDDPRGRHRGSRDRHDPSAYSMDMRPKPPEQMQHSSRSRSRSPGGRRALRRSPQPSPPRRSRSRSPAAGRAQRSRRDAGPAAAAAPRSPARVDSSPPRPRSSSARRGASPADWKGREPLDTGDRRDARERSRGEERTRGRSSSPAGAKRKRDADSSRRAAAAADDSSKRSRREGGARDVAPADNRGRSLANVRESQQEQQQRHRSASPRRPRVAAAAGDAAARGGGGGRSPVHNIEAVARRFSGRLEGAQDIFADIQLERDVKGWLSELAVIAGQPPRPLEQPNPIKVGGAGGLVHQLPLPRHILEAYQSFNKFVTARPELSFGVNKNHIVLLPQHHAELLSAKDPAVAHRGGGSGRAAAADASDPEDYLTEHRAASKRRTSNTRSDRGNDTAAAGAPGSASRRDRARDKHEAEPGDGRDGDGGTAAGDRADGRGREQRQAWQEDKQPYPMAKGDAGASGGGRVAAPWGSRAHEHVQERVGGAGRGRGHAGQGGGRSGGRAGRGPVLPPPPTLHLRLAEEVLQEFGHVLASNIDRSSTGCVSMDKAYKLLPLPLADRVVEGSKLPMSKLLADHYPQFELRREGGKDGGMFVGRHPDPGARYVPHRVCKYWDPVKLDGCAKGAVCDFKHVLAPDAMPY